MIRQLLVLGASGDLTGRYLLPAVAQRYEMGRLPSHWSLPVWPVTTGHHRSAANEQCCRQLPIPIGR